MELLQLGCCYGRRLLISTTGLDGPSLKRVGGRNLSRRKKRSFSTSSLGICGQRQRVVLRSGTRYTGPVDFSCPSSNRCRATTHHQRHRLGSEARQDTGSDTDNRRSAASCRGTGHTGPLHHALPRCLSVFTSSVSPINAPARQRRDALGNHSLWSSGNARSNSSRRVSPMRSMHSHLSALATRLLLLLSSSRNDSHCCRPSAKPAATCLRNIEDGGGAQAGRFRC